MANRVWGGGSSSSEDSESEYSEESVSSQDEGSDSQRNQRYFGSSSSGDEVRVMKSKKEKVLEVLTSIVSSLMKAITANDWLQITEHWDKLLKQEKPLRQALPTLPVAFTRSLVKLDDLIKGFTKDQIQKLDGNHRRAFLRLQNGIKKQLGGFSDIMTAYREKPEAGADDDDSEDAAPSDESSDSDKDTPASVSKAGKSGKKPAKHSWFKKDSDSDSGSETDSESDSDSVDESSKSKGPRNKQQKVVEEVNWTAELVDQKIVQYLANRSKKGRSDRKTVIQQLRFLKSKAHTSTQTLKILVGLLTQVLDQYSSVDAVIPQQIWHELLHYTKSTIDLLETDSSLADHIVYEASAGVPSSVEDNKSGALRILAFTEKLGDSLLRSFQETETHSIRYMNLLRNESRYYTLCLQAQVYFQKREIPEAIARIAIRNMDLLYFKRDEYDTAPLPILEPIVLSQTFSAPSKAASDDEETEDDFSSAPATPSQVDISDGPLELPVEPGTPTITQRLKALAALIYKHGSPVLRTQALLMDAYHLALHDRFSEARNMVLVSHLQETIGGMDVSVQILFNRTMVQLGLAAFRQGLIADAQFCLTDLYSSTRPNHKELLAQGLSVVRYGLERPPEKESLEKRRQIPFHKHINLDLIECVHLVSVLLLEVPNHAAHQFDVKHKSLSRTFNRLINVSERQLWGIGPAENPREHIVAASRHLTKGDWQTAAEVLLQLKCWKQFPNSDAVKRMLFSKIQEAALRTWIFSNSAHYDSLSIEQLSLLFQLPQQELHRLLSQMIIDGELHASHHQPTNSIVLHQVEPTRLQSLALQFADKVSKLVEQSDKSVEARPSFSSTFESTRRGLGTSNKSRAANNFNRGASRNISRGNTTTQNTRRIPNTNQQSGNRRGNTSLRGQRGRNNSRGSRRP